MFDIGFLEILVIGVLALLVVGPERLPSAIRSTMSTVRSIKKMANGFKEEVASQLDTHELHENLKKAEQLGMENIGSDLQSSVDQLKAAADSVQRPYKRQDTPSQSSSSQNTASIEQPKANTMGSVENEPPISNSQANPKAHSKSINDGTHSND